MVFIASGIVQLVLRIQLAVLQPHDSGPVDPGLPGRLAQVLDGAGLGIVKDVRHLLEGLVGRLGEAKEDVPEHGEAKDGEEHVRLPRDVGERGRDKVRERKVEGPVARGGQGDGFATDTQGVELRGVRPRDRAPGRGVRGHKEVCAGDDSLGGRAGNGHGLGV